MANNDKKYQKKKIQDTEGSGFGKYQEGVGGGESPNDSSKGTHGHGANSDYRKENNDTMQARTSDGKFTYKSVNGQSIDPKYGPSRGKTVNPLLTGGKNGIKIDDVEKQFSAQSGSYWDKYKDKWYTKGGEMALASGKTFKTHVASEAIWNVAKERYDVNKGEFIGESHTFDETKKGKSNLEEKAAKQKAQTSGEEQAVIDSNTGGIKVKGGVQLPPVQPQSQPAQPTPPTPVAPGAGQQPEKQPENTVSAGVGAEASAPQKGQTGVKYGEEEVAKVKEWFKNKFSDNPAKLEDLINKMEGLSPEQLDKQIDMWISKGVPFDLGGNGKNAASPEEKEDSETIKKIKNMGFSA